MFTKNTNLHYYDLNLFQFKCLHRLVFNFASTAIRIVTVYLIFTIIHFFVE